ncbi:hypothetical protein Tco_1327123 [Tanacetum coccineum]
MATIVLRLPNVTQGGQILFPKAKSRMSPFTNSQGRKGKNEAREFVDKKDGFKGLTKSQNLKKCRGCILLQTIDGEREKDSFKGLTKSLKKWFLVANVATLSNKRALLPIKKLRSSLLANSKLHRTLFGFIVFRVEWKDVCGLNYLNELLIDTSLAVEAKYMKRWEFDSIAQAAKSRITWFPGTSHERCLLEEHLNSMLGLGYLGTRICSSEVSREHAADQQLFELLMKLYELTR